MNITVSSTDLNSPGEAGSESSASPVAKSDWLQLEMQLNVSPRQRQQQQQQLRNQKAATKTAAKSSGSRTKAASNTAQRVAKNPPSLESASDQMDISEYVRLLQRLRRRRRLLDLNQGGRRQLERLNNAQRRLRQMLAAHETSVDDSNAWEVEEADVDYSSSMTLLDCSLWDTGSVAAAARHERESIKLREVNREPASKLMTPVNKLQQPPSELESKLDQKALTTPLEATDARLEATPREESLQESHREHDTGTSAEQPFSADILTPEEQISASSNAETPKRPGDLVLQMPEPLEATAKQNQRNRLQYMQSVMLPKPLHQPPPKPARPLPQLPLPPPPGPKSTLSLTPMMALRLREPVLSLAFDPVGRRLICADPSRGVCFRSVTFSGDDLAATDCLDWHLWAHATCVLPSGHLLVATASNLQVIRPDGVRLSSCERRCLTIAMTVHERIVLTLSYKLLEKEKDREQRLSYIMSVFELPRLNARHRHPLSDVLPHNLKSPVAMCTLHGLVAIAQLDDTLLTIEIDTGRLRQSLHVSSSRGPQQLASCSKIGLLFVSVFADRCIHIYKLQGGILEKAGSFRDPSILPGPLAWLPGNGILFCACSLVSDVRRSELRTLGLHEADRTNWTPKAIRLMPL